MSGNSPRRSVSRGHHRSMSRDSQGTIRLSLHSSSPQPTQTFHPSILPRSVPTPSMVESVAGGAHYSGVKMDPDTMRQHRRSFTARPHNQLKDSHKRVLDDLTELYCARPTKELFQRLWSKNAEFEDPLCKAKGFDQCAAQWFAMPKVVLKSEQLSKRVMSSTDQPNRFIYYQTQEYTLRFLKKKKIINSIITVDLDDNEKIIRLVDQWNGKDLPTRYGASLLRSMNGKVAPWLVHIPKASH